jgi:hypothetical protein
MDNAKKPSAALIAGIVALVFVLGIAAFFFLKDKEGSIAENGSSNEPLPKEIVVASPDEARNAASEILGRTASGTALSSTEYGQLRKEMQGTGTTKTGGTVANGETIASKVAELKKNGKEYLEDYLRNTYETKQSFDTQKILALPLGDAGAFERFLSTLSQYDPAALGKIGPALLKRTTFGIEFDENSLEGYLAKNYTAGNLDYEKMKGLSIRNELGLLFLMTEIYYSPSKKIIDQKLEGVIAHKVSLIPKNNIVNPRYQNLNRILSFFQVTNGKESINAARTLREAQLQYLQAGNYPLLKTEADKTLFADASRLLEKYKAVASMEDVKKQSVSADLTAARGLLTKMDASADFKKYYLGVAVFNNFIAALEIANGNPDAAVAAIKHNDDYQFVNADGLARPASSMGQDWNYAVAYEAKGDVLLAKGEKDGAKQAYETGKEHMSEYSFARPHYVLPREYVKKLVSKIANL